MKRITLASVLEQALWNFKAPISSQLYPQNVCVHILNRESERGDIAAQKAHGSISLKVQGALLRTISCIHMSSLYVLHAP